MEYLVNILVRDKSKPYAIRKITALIYLSILGFIPGTVIAIIENLNKSASKPIEIFSYILTILVFRAGYLFFLSKNINDGKKWIKWVSSAILVVQILFIKAYIEMWVKKPISGVLDALRLGVDFYISYSLFFDASIKRYFELANNDLSDESNEADSGMADSGDGGVLEFVAPANFWSVNLVKVVSCILVGYLGYLVDYDSYVSIHNLLQPIQNLIWLWIIVVIQIVCLAFILVNLEVNPIVGVVFKGRLLEIMLAGSKKLIPVNKILRVEFHAIRELFNRSHFWGHWPAITIVCKGKSYLVPAPRLNELKAAFQSKGIIVSSRSVSLGALSLLGMLCFGLFLIGWQKYLALAVGLYFFLTKDTTFFKSKDLLCFLIFMLTFFGHMFVWMPMHPDDRQHDQVKRIRPEIIDYCLKTEAEKKMAVAPISDCRHSLKQYAKFYDECSKPDMIQRSPGLRNTCVWFHVTAPTNSMFAKLENSFELITTAIREERVRARRTDYQDTLACLYWLRGDGLKAIEIAKTKNLERDFNSMKKEDRCR